MGDRKGYPLLQNRTMFFQRQAKLQKKEFIEGQGPVGRSGPVVQQFEFGFVSREMDFLQSLADRHQGMAVRNLPRQEGFHQRSKLVHHFLEHLAYGLLVQPFGERVDGNGSPEIYGVPGHHGRQVFSWGNPFHIRVMYLSLITVLNNLAGYYRFFTRLPDSLHITLIEVEPFQRHRSAFITDDRFVIFPATFC